MLGLGREGGSAIKVDACAGELGHGGRGSLGGSSCKIPMNLNAPETRPLSHPERDR